MKRNLQATVLCLMILSLIACTSKPAPPGDIEAPPQTVEASQPGSHGRDLFPKTDSHLNYNLTDQTFSSNELALVDGDRLVQTFNDNPYVTWHFRPDGVYRAAPGNKGPAAFLRYLPDRLEDGLVWKQSVGTEVYLFELTKPPKCPVPAAGEAVCWQVKVLSMSESMTFIFAEGLGVVQAEFTNFATPGDSYIKTLMMPVGSVQVGQAERQGYLKGATTWNVQAAAKIEPVTRNQFAEAAAAKEDNLAMPSIDFEPGAPVGAADSSLGGVKLGITVDEARRLLGPLKASSGPWGPYWRYNGAQGSLDLYEENGIIIEVETSDLPTPRGLRIGNPQEKVELVYGKPASVSAKYTPSISEWIYEGPRPFKLLVGMREGRVGWFRIINISVSQPKPEPGRDINAVTPVKPLGPADFVIAGFNACWTDEQAKRDGRLEPYLPKDSRASSGYATKDRFIQLLNDPAGLNTFGGPRWYRTIVTGGSYQTARDVRVGDPESRVAALYGQTKRSEHPRGSSFAYSLGDLTLIFTANLNGRITDIGLVCG